ncbi:MAG: YicC family protein [Proteobacteria bacterium]|nr:YicC family protein [Pseudomonadota bacterium]
MSISGMTGFARAEGEHDGLRWIWEVKSVNGRGFDLKLRLPSGYDGLEQPARAAAAQVFKRGSLQATLSFARDPLAAPPPRIDFALIEQLLAAGDAYLAAKRVRKPTWDGVLALRGVMQSEDAAELTAEARVALDAALNGGFALALQRLSEARQAEGRMLAAALSDLAGKLEAQIGDARGIAAGIPNAVRARIVQRLEGLAPDVKLDAARLAQEAALAATKADVQAELARLAAHAGELRVLLTKPEPAGRRLEFLSQELTREANTLCSKSADLELTRIGLDMKVTVDQIREQAANVE